MISLAEIWRYPIKSHSREALDHVDIAAGQSLPLDRAWAVIHDATDQDGRQWAPCRNFTIGSKAPSLNAIHSQWLRIQSQLCLTHPTLGTLTIDPETDGADLVEWTKSLIPDTRPKSTRLVKCRERGMTDTDYPSITIGNLASHRALEQIIGKQFSHKRWRCNLWVDGAEPWAEFDWVGKTLRIGAVEFEIRERVKRCNVTTACADTGQRDIAMLSVLNGLGHQDFTVYAVATTSGTITQNQKVEIL